MGFLSDIFSPVIDAVSSVGKGAYSVLQKVGEVTDADRWIGELPHGRKAQRFFYNISGAPIYESLGQRTGLLGDSSLFNYQNTNQLANVLGKAYLGYVAGGGDPTLGSSAGSEGAATAATTTAGPTGAGAGGEMTFTVDPSLAPAAGSGTAGAANTGAAVTGAGAPNVGLEAFTTQSSLAPASAVTQTSPYVISPQEWDYLYGGGPAPYIGQAGLNPAMSKYAEYAYAQKFGDAAMDRIKREVVTRGVDTIVKKFLPGLLGLKYQSFTPKDAPQINGNYTGMPLSQTTTAANLSDQTGMMVAPEWASVAKPGISDNTLNILNTTDYSLQKKQEEEKKKKLEEALAYSPDQYLYKNLDLFA